MPPAEGATYDRIGLTYAELRKPDPRIARRIDAALGSARMVVNVGAGTGSYEPPDRAVTAVEPSLAMIRQRAPDAAPAVQANAERLPFADAGFDAAMAILTIHHWPDLTPAFHPIATLQDYPVRRPVLDTGPRCLGYGFGANSSR